MKKIKNKKILLIIVLLVVISTTIAFLYSTDTFQNIFVAASYKVTVTEEFVSPESWVPGDETDKTVTLKNEGTVPIKVRVKLEEEWKDSNGEDLPLQHNGEDVAIINFSNQDDYIYKDGYYYYDPILNPGETTSSILKSVTFNPNYSGTVTCEYTDDYTEVCTSSESGYEGGTYKLTLTIEGVQEDYYVQAWNLTGIVERQYLYNVLKNETESGGLAREYTGQHHDSFTEEPSKDIYHWYAKNNSEGPMVKNKNNVVFAKHCWQMFRTTDTGGVKMIYNGEAINNQCLDTREKHTGYNSLAYEVLTDNYWYGTDYTYDSVNNQFSLSGEMEQATWGQTTWPNLIGKYTCKSNSAFDSCSTLYLIESYNRDYNAIVIPLNSDSLYYQFGKVYFNKSPSSLAYVGYKYGDPYKYGSTIGTGSESFINSESMIYTSSLSTSYWYADSISYNPTTRKYSLVNPYQVDAYTDFPNLIGKYSFRNASQTYTNNYVYYIAGVRNATMYYKNISSGNSLSAYEPIMIGESISDNYDGTYTINNPIAVTLRDWYANYSNYNNKYTCGSGIITCAEPRYLTNTTNAEYSFVNANNKMMIGKSRNGLNLIDTLLIRRDEWYNNWSNYSDYKYTCNTDNATCTESTIKMIVSKSATGYDYAPNHYYGSSVTWDGTNYTLVNPIEIENYNNLENISTHHFICPNYGDKVCTSVGYVYYYSGTGSIKYITLENGITTVSKAIEDMLTKNTTNSFIKSGIDAWYKHFMTPYDSYIEDTIYCNNRTITKIAGWNPEGGMTNEWLEFKESSSTDLSCTNVTDQFSVSNNNAKLEFKVGLMSAPEIGLLNNHWASATGAYYILGTPKQFHYSTNANVYIAHPDGGAWSGSVSMGEGLRPAISLKPGIEYSDGDGSKEHPYIVKMD